MGTEADHERVRLHPLVASYVGTLFESDVWPDDDRNTARDAVVAYYADYANGTDDAGRELDETNITGTIKLAAALGDDPRVARIVNGMADFWRDHSRTETRERYLSLGLEAARRVAEHDGATPADRLRIALLLYSLADLQWQLGDLDAAEMYATESHETYRTSGSRRDEGASLKLLGDIALQRGDLNAAQALYEQYLAIMREVKDRREEGIAVTALGRISRRRGDLDGAERSYLLALEIDREVKDRRGEAVDLSDLGDIAHERGDLDAARASFEQSLAIMREVKDRREEGVALASLGDIAWQRGDLDAARASFEQYLAIMREVKDHKDIGVALYKLAVIFERSGRLDEAESYHRKSLEIAHQVQSPRDTADSLVELGRFLLEHKRDTKGEACGMLADAAGLYDQIGLAEQAEEARETARQLGCGN